MASPTSRNLTTLDFESIKENFKSFLKSQDTFNDYDFEGSNINVLLDVLSYNTQLNAFYLNMLASEMFLDSAQLRDSVISHTKELNYLPKSFRSAQADVTLTIADDSTNSVTIPKGTTFTGTAGSRDFTFTTGENIIVGGTDNVFTASNVILYEGDYISDSYVVNNAAPERYIINNKTVDTTSVEVTVIEDNGATIIPYQLADSLFGLSSTSLIYFLQPAENDTYEIVFGDGVIGRKPKDRSVVLIQYRFCNGELPNGVRTFVADGKINGTGTVTAIVVNTAASGGAIPEDIESIRFNAPRAFTTQERVVTAKDYETLLKNEFSEINAVSAYGGEEVSPPQFGKVIVAVDLKNTDSLPQSKKTKYTNFIKQRSPLAIEPVFVEPDFTYIKVSTNVKYNVNNTSLERDDIKALVVDSILNYNDVFLNGFNKTLRYSKFVAAIDNAQFSIISNDTELFVTKLLEPTLRIEQDYVIDFGLELRDDIAQLNNQQTSIIESSLFLYNGIYCSLEDDGLGNIIMLARDDQNVVPGAAHLQRPIKKVGTVDYSTGVVQLNSFRVDGLLSGVYIELYARAKEKDITSQRRTILSIRESDIAANIQQVRL